MSNNGPGVDKGNWFAPASYKSEQIIAKFWKGLLRVPRHASNTAVYGELGQYPLRLFIPLPRAKYFDHMTNGNNALLKEALVSEIQLYCRGFPNLTSIHTNLFSKLGFNIASILLSLTTSPDILTILKLVLSRNTRHGSGGQLTLSKVHQGRGETNLLGRMPVLKTVIKLSHIWIVTFQLNMLPLCQT